MNRVSILLTSLFCFACPQPMHDLDGGAESDAGIEDAGVVELTVDAGPSTCAAVAAAVSHLAEATGSCSTLSGVSRVDPAVCEGKIVACTAEERRELDRVGACFQRATTCMAGSADSEMQWYTDNYLACATLLSVVAADGGVSTTVSAQCLDSIRP
jgi:hypothetical protein